MFVSKERQQQWSDIQEKEKNESYIQYYPDIHIKKSYLSAYMSRFELLQPVYINSPISKAAFMQRQTSQGKKNSTSLYLAKGFLLICNLHCLITAVQ